METLLVTSRATCLHLIIGGKQGECLELWWNTGKHLLYLSGRDPGAHVIEQVLYRRHDIQRRNIASVALASRDRLRFHARKPNKN
jgi:hypothetical protein